MVVDADGGEAAAQMAEPGAFDDQGGLAHGDHVAAADRAEPPCPVLAGTGLAFAVAGEVVEGGEGVFGDVFGVTPADLGVVGEYP